MAVNDDIRNALESYGGFSINTRVYNYLGSLGYTGTISDRLAKYMYEDKKGWQALIARFSGGLSELLQLQQLLFGNEEKGLLFVPEPGLEGKDVLYQDSAGTTLADADGDPVGLGLEWSKGLELGPELVTNGTFDTDSDWTKGTGWTISGGTATGSSGTTGDLVQTLTGLNIGSTYEVTLEVVEWNGSGTISLEFGDYNTGYVGVEVREWKFLAKAELESDDIVIGQGSAAAFSIDNISVRELPGNHLTQLTSADRPTYNTDGSLHWLAFDGAGDNLNAESVRVALGSNNFSAFLLFKRSSTKEVALLGGDITSEFCLIAQPGNTTGTIAENGGLVPQGMVTRIDGTEKTTRDAIHVATSDLDWHVWEIESMSTSEWSSMFIGVVGEASSFDAYGELGGVIIVDESTTVDRQAARNYLAKLAGITL